MHTATTPGPQDPAARPRAPRARPIRAAAVCAAAAAALACAPGASGAPGTHPSAPPSPAPVAAASPSPVPVVQAADLVCRVFVEQDNLSFPLNKDGTTTSPNEIKGATVGCSSPNGAFAPGNRRRNPVLASSSYTSVGGPSLNKVTELNGDCTAFTQDAQLRFTWNTGAVSIGRLSIDGGGKWTSKILSGPLEGDRFAPSGPALADIDSYLTYLGSCGPANPGGRLDGFVFNSWLPGLTGSAGHEIGLTFTRT